MVSKKKTRYTYITIFILDWLKKFLFSCARSKNELIRLVWYLMYGVDATGTFLPLCTEIVREISNPNRRIGAIIVLNDIPSFNGE